MVSFTWSLLSYPLSIFLSFYLSLFHLLSDGASFGLIDLSKGYPSSNETLADGSHGLHCFPPFPTLLLTILTFLFLLRRVLWIMLIAFFLFNRILVVSIIYWTSIELIIVLYQLCVYSLAYVHGDVTQTVSFLSCILFSTLSSLSLSLCLSLLSLSCNSSACFFSLLSSLSISLSLLIAQMVSFLSYLPLLIFISWSIR